MEVGACARRFEWIDAAGEERDDDAAEDVAHAAGGHAGIAGRIHVDVTFGIRDERLMSFEYDDAVGDACCFARDVDAMSVDRLCVAIAEKPGELAGMRRNDARTRLRIDLVCT